jgi:hypothetical protein
MGINVGRSIVRRYRLYSKASFSFDFQTILHHLGRRLIGGEFGVTINLSDGRFDLSFSASGAPW